MCTIAIRFDEVSGGIAVAANRDEAYERPSDPPLVLEAAPRIVGGRDRVAGGTWLALRETAPRRVVAILNRREHAAAPPAAPPHALSRGLLALEAARLDTLEDLETAVADRVRTFPMAPFTLLALEATGGLAFAFEAATLRIGGIQPGVHAWTHGDADDPSDERVRRVLAAGRAAASLPSDDFLTALVPALASHDGERPVCLHAGAYGTVSSTLLAVPLDGPPTWRFAGGPPCRTPFAIMAVALPAVAVPPPAATPPATPPPPPPPAAAS